MAKPTSARNARRVDFPSSAESPSLQRPNLVVLRGVVASDPQQRLLPSGPVFETSIVTRSLVDGIVVREPVPVVWSDDRFRFRTGAEVIVRGRVRQRFFRSGPSTVSRTEVVVEEVVLPSRRPATAKLVDRALHALHELGECG